MTKSEIIARLTNLEICAEGLFNSWVNYERLSRAYHDEYADTIKEIKRLENLKEIDSD